MQPPCAGPWPRPPSPRSPSPPGGRPVARGRGGHRRPGADHAARRLENRLALLRDRLQRSGHTGVDVVGILGPQGCGIAHDGDNEGHGGIRGTDVAARTATLDQADPGWAAATSTSASPVVVVDRWTGFDTATDTGDGAHPSDAGTRKTADWWYPAVVAALGAAPSPSTRSWTVTLTFATGRR